MHQLLCPPSLH
ncbi:hypothetical protein D018_0346A, partial [Vibrio parahaemolyticus VP2007-007]